MSTDERQPADEHEPQLLTSYGLFLIAALVLVVGFAAPQFRVSHISVQGRNLPVAAIVRSSGAEGRNIFTIRGASIVHSLEQVPNVFVNGVNISLPDTVIIRATARKPVFAWRQGSSLFQVDQYGRLISRVASTSLPTVQNNSGRAYGLGDYISPAVTLGVVYSIKTVRNVGIRFVLGKRRGIYLYSKQGWFADLGIPSPRQLVVKIATLRSFINKKSSRRLISVNLLSRSPFARYAP